MTALKKFIEDVKRAIEMAARIVIDEGEEAWTASITVQRVKVDVRLIENGVGVDISYSAGRDETPEDVSGILVALAKATGHEVSATFTVRQAITRSLIVSPNETEEGVAERYRIFTRLN